MGVGGVRRVVSGFVGKGKSVDVFNGGNFKDCWSVAMQRVARIVDSYLSEIATYGELSISKFNGIANLVPKGARRTDDDLYRAIDIYLKVRLHLFDLVDDDYVLFVCVMIRPPCSVFTVFFV